MTSANNLLRITASEFGRHIGHYMRLSEVEPIIIVKHGYAHTVLVGHQLLKKQIKNARQRLL